jgi:hypothetical protein
MEQKKVRQNRTMLESTMSRSNSALLCTGDLECSSSGLITFWLKLDPCQDCNEFAVFSGLINKPCSGLQHIFAEAMCLQALISNVSQKPHLTHTWLAEIPVTQVPSAARLT